MLGLGLALGVGSGCRRITEQVEPCVFARFEDGAQLQRVLEAWSRDAGLGPVERFDLQVRPRRASLRLSTSRWAGTLLVEIESQCSAPLRVRVASGRALSERTIAQLGRVFPVARRPQGSMQLRVHTSILGISLERLFFWGGMALILLGLGLDRWKGKIQGRIGSGAVVVLVVACLALALAVSWPLWTAPFESDSPFLRAAYARENPFGDWNHPFLSYLLMHPIARYTLEPMALRMVPLLALLLEVGLLGWAAARASGATAGILAPLWFVAEIPRRHGMDELGDWDLAGAVLVAMLLLLLSWRQDRVSAQGEVGSWRGTGVLAIAVLVGFFSSYLFVVPAVVLLAAVAFEMRRPEGAPKGASGRGRPWVRLLPLGAACGLAAFWGFWVFWKGRFVGDVPPSGSSVIGGMIRELPTARAPWMAVPILAGVAWLGAAAFSPGDPGRRGRLAARFVLGVLVAVPGAVAIAWRASHVNGGYYVGLITPLWLWAGAVGLCWGVGPGFRWVASRLRWVGAGRQEVGKARNQVGETRGRAREMRWRTRALRGLPAAGAVAATLGLWVATGRPPGYAREQRLAPSGAERLPDFAELLQADAAPVVTNCEHLPLFVGVGRIWRGQDPGGVLLPPGGPADVLRRGRWMDAACRPVARIRGRSLPRWRWDGLARPFLLVLEQQGGRLPPCALALARRCVPLFPVRHWLRFYRCGAPGRRIEAPASSRWNGHRGPRRLVGNRAR